MARGYGYAKEDDPLVKAFQAGVRALRAKDWPSARTQVAAVRWQLDELRDPADLGVDYSAAFAAAHAAEEVDAAIEAWVNLVYLGLLQKLHWNLEEKLANYHRARARLDAAQTYYELALAGNLRRDDAARRAQDPQAPSRHEDVIANFKAARTALGSPGLLGAGKRAPDLEAFRAAALRIAGHLRAVFPRFARPKAARKSAGDKQATPQPEAPR